MPCQPTHTPPLTQLLVAAIEVGTHIFVEKPVEATAV
jgi:predicted dehydrogenase